MVMQIRGPEPMRRTCIILFFLLIFAFQVHTFAQDFDIDPNANISWPPPVYVLRGEFELRGTANLPNMVSYFLEYRPLNDDLAPNETMSWLPATLPSQTKVVDDVLAIWDTTTVPDGIYELRMTLNVTGGNPVYVIVTPVRVENAGAPVESPTPAPTMTPEPPAELPTLEPTATEIDLTPRAEIIVDSANVRTGDSTAYAVMDGLNLGTLVEIVGLSTTGSGWYQIILPDSRRGWVSPTVVRVSGDVRSVPRVAPPPPPPPTATPIPATQANLAIQSITLDPGQPTCGQTMTITVVVVNNGSGTAGGGTVAIQDIHLASGTGAGSTSGVFPNLNPGQTFAPVMRLTVDTFFNETHRINVTVDSTLQVPETNEGDNGGFRDYTLQRGSCG
jgi:hypothetical protein